MMSCIMISWHCSSGDIHSFSYCMMYSFQACFVLYDVVIMIFKLSFPLTHYACYVVADSHVCHEQSTCWQVIQPQPCEGQNKYFVCCLFLNFGCPFLPCIIWRSTCQGIFQGVIPCVMQPAVQHSIPQAVGCRCAHCTSEFDTRNAMDCHCRKQSSLGTGCSNPSTSKSVSFTGRASFALSIVWEHDILGAHTNHTEAVCVYRQLLPLTFNRNIDLLI